MANWIPFTLDEPLAAWAGDVQPLVQDALQTTAPVGKGPTAGQFRDSIEAYVTNGGREIDAEGDQPPGTFLLTGTEAHEIVPVNAKVLRFESGGQVVFARRVQHPGTEPSDFVTRAIDSGAEEWASMLLDQIAQAWASA